MSIYLYYFLALMSTNLILMNFHHFGKTYCYSIIRYICFSVGGIRIRIKTLSVA